MSLGVRLLQTPRELDLSRSFLRELRLELDFVYACHRKLGQRTDR